MMNLYLIHKNMFCNLPQFSQVKRSILSWLYFVFCKKLWLTSKINEEIEGSCYPEDKSCNCHSSINIKIVVILSKHIKKHVPGLGPWIPGRSTEKTVDWSKQWLRFDIYETCFMCCLQPNAVKTKHMTKKVNNIQESLNQNMSPGVEKRGFITCWRHCSLVWRVHNNPVCYAKLLNCSLRRLVSKFIPGLR